MIQQIMYEPSESGNACNIRKECYPIQKLLMIRYEELYNFYSEEPIYVNAKIDTIHKEFISFEQIFRFRYWIPNERACSWIIYSEERELGVSSSNISGLVIRCINWDKKIEKSRVKDPKNDKEKLFRSWPIITTNSWFIRKDDTKEIIDSLQLIDEAIKNGLILEDKNAENNQEEWKDIELLRLFDWGQIHTTWSSIKTNVNVEKLLCVLEEQLISTTNNVNSTIDTLVLDFSCPPNVKMSLVNADIWG